MAAAIDNQLFVAFSSTHAAMAAQALLKDLAAKLIPTPRQIDASCGMTLQVEEPDAPAARARILEREDIATLSQFYIYAAGDYMPCD